MVRGQRSGVRGLGVACDTSSMVEQDLLETQGIETRAHLENTVQDGVLTTSKISVWDGLPGFRSLESRAGTQNENTVQNSVFLTSRIRVGNGLLATSTVEVVR
jgi:hypothetical protein